MNQQDYRKWLISEILQRKNNHNTAEQLHKYSTRTLERLFDYCD